MSVEAELTADLIRQSKRRLLEESLPKIRTCLTQLTQDEIWARPNANTVSVGNLVLHLSGNVRQYIIATLGGVEDLRERQKEFDEKGPMPTPDLLARLEGTMAEASAVIGRLDPAALLKHHRVQGYDYTGLGVLLHVVEHFSYHTGQIIYAVKSRKNVDLGFYKGVDLNKRK